MGCNLKDIAPAEQTSLKELAGKRVGIDAFLTAFQFLTTMRDRSPQGDGMPLRMLDGDDVQPYLDQIELEGGAPTPEAETKAEGGEPASDPMST